MREVIPSKVIISSTEAGVLQTCILQYKLKIDGVMQNKFYTINVMAGLSAQDLQKIITDSISQATSSENPQ